MQGLIRDVRFMLRNIARSPGLSMVIALSLAIGIGANTAIFSLYRAMLLKPLPVRGASSLVLLYWGAEKAPRGVMQSSDGPPRDSQWASSSRSLSFPFFQQITARTDVFSSVFAFAPLGTGRQNTTVAFTPSDPLTLTVSAVVLLATAGLAGYLPARCATLIDPAAALKQQ